MNAFYDIMTLDIWQSVLWVLVHTLWQGIGIAVVLWVLLKWIPVRQAQWRYWMAFIGLVTVVMGALTTWSIGHLPGTQAVHAAVDDVPDINDKYAVVLTTMNPQAKEETAHPSHEGFGQIGAGCVVGFWGLGVLMMLLRVAFSLRAAQALVESGRALEDMDLLQRIASLRERLRLHRRVLVKLVDVIDVPAVIGVIRPTLLLPLAFLNEMSPAQVEVVLAHELAHIRRYDVLFGLVQRVIEALLFFNPAVWWISRQVSLECEACCDAAAARITGPRESVAQALFDVVKRLHRPVPGLSAAVALHNGNRQGHFTERLRRLVEPGARARLRLPWVSFGLLVIMTGLGLAILHWGTNRAVTKAAELLSPKQHIERIELAKEAYEAPDDPLLEGVEGKFVVRGTVRTDDGSPLPDDLYIELRGHYPRGGIACYDAYLSGGVFHCTIRQRRVSVIAYSDTFAPLVVGPLDIESEQGLENIELVLQPGFVAQVKLHDPTGQPVKDARVDYSYHCRNATLRSGSAISDESGLLTFSHATDLPIGLSVRKSGFQFDYLKTQLSKNEPLGWILLPAEPTVGTLVSKVNGRPMPNVPIYLLSRKGFHDRVFDVRKSYIQKDCRLTETDAKGRFVLDNLRTDCIYALYIDGTEHYGPDILPGIVAGQQDLRLEISAPRYVQGRILGDYEPHQERFNSRKDVPALCFTNNLHFGNMSFCSGVHTQLIKLTDQVGWSFKIPNLLPNDVRISLQGHPTRTIPEINEAIEDYIIDLRPNALDPSIIAQETRTVVVRLIVPQGWPVPTGKIRVDHVMTDRNAYKPYWLDLQNGQVQLDVPMLAHGQGKFKYESCKDLIGYWIKETRGIPIPPGNDPYVIEVPAYPAGAVHGEVLGWDGKPVDNASVYMETVEKSPDAQDKRLPLDYSINVGPEGRFVFSPVPLEGIYQLKAYRSYDNERSLVFSKELTVTRETPTQIVSLTLPVGKTRRGRIVNSDGQGLRQAKVALNYKYKHGSHGGSSITAGADGYFQFVHVNTDADCHYTYRVSSTGNYCGCEVAVNMNGIQTIVLEEGHRVCGRIIDSNSRGLIPGAELSFHTYDRSARNKDRIKTQTNARGEFIVRGLEAVEYRVWIEGATHPNTQITENPDGTVSFRGSESIIVHGKQRRPVDIAVQLKPHSRLQPLPAE